MHLRVLLFVVSFTLIFSAETYSQAESRSCRIKTMIGSVKVRRSGTVNWMNARVGMPLRERDGIRTFVESEVELETSEGTLIKISENSTMELSRFQESPDAQNTKVKIMNGSIISNVKKLVSSTSSFEFETPTATAAIRGTIVGFNVNKETTSIKVYEGRVLVTAIGARKSTELKGNEMSTITRKTKNIVVEQFASTQPPDSATKLSDSTVIIDSSKTDSTVTADTSVNSNINEEKSDTLEDDSTGISKPDSSIETNIESKKDSVYQKSESSGNLIPLKLNVTSPAEGSSAVASSQITVTGAVTPFKAIVSVNGKTITSGTGGTFKTTINIPEISGYYEVNITAELDGTSQTVIRTIKIKSPNLVFSVLNPKDKQVYSKPIIPVSGTVTAGAEVSVMSMNVPITAQGAFNSQIPIPNEEGEYLLEFEASLEGKSQKINRTIIYKPEHRFILTQPQDRQVISSTTVPIRGEIFPSSATINVQGKRIAVSAQGSFSGYINIPDEEGEVILDFEIISGGISKNEQRTIVYKRPPDTYAPKLQGVLPVSSLVPRIPFTVMDPTIDEEITFYYEIDGSRESQTGPQNSPFSVMLQEGIHNYKVYAVDKAGNRSPVITQTISYLGSSVWSIKLRKPLGDIVLNLPPSTPDGNYKPRYPVEFSIDNLPDNNIKLIREITVTNSTTSETIQLRNLTDTYVEAEIGLSHRASNVILIEALDVNNIKKTKKLQIHVR